MDIGGPQNTGTGPQWAVARGGFLYLYVQDAYARDPVTDLPHFGYTVARTPLGTNASADWRKFYQGAWTEPPIGGRATSLTNFTGAKMVFVEAASVWLAVDYSGGLMTSADGILWDALPSPVLPVRPPGQSPTAGYNDSNIIECSCKRALQDYTTSCNPPLPCADTSLVPGRGGNILAADDSLWLYYCFVRATDPGGWAHAPRGLAAARITFSSSASASGPSVLLPLSQYTALNASQQQWATVSPVDPRFFEWSGLLAWTLASPASVTVRGTVTVPLLDCVWLETGGHFPARLGECGAAFGQGTWPPLKPPPGSNVSQLTPGYLGSLG